MSASVKDRRDSSERQQSAFRPDFIPREEFLDADPLQGIHPWFRLGRAGAAVLAICWITVTMVEAGDRLSWLNLLAGCFGIAAIATFTIIVELHATNRKERGNGSSEPEDEQTGQRANGNAQGQA